MRRLDLVIGLAARGSYPLGTGAATSSCLPSPTTAGSTATRAAVASASGIAAQGNQDPASIYGIDVWVSVVIMSPGTIRLQFRTFGRPKGNAVKAVETAGAAKFSLAAALRAAATGARNVSAARGVWIVCAIRSITAG
eukprot:scaffold332103_cov55-Prasinocladus_malaysianus.AAC.1